MPLRVQILMYHGVEEQDFRGGEQDFIGPRDVPGHAERAGGQVHTTLVRPSAPGTVICFFGTEVTVRAHGSPPTRIF